MLRAIALPIISMLLISSLLAPPIMSLFSQESCLVMMLSPEEEDKGSEKEAEKKQDEKDLFVNKLVAAYDMFSKEKPSNPLSYVLYLTEYKPDIIVPPPRVSV